MNAFLEVVYYFVHEDPGVRGQRVNALFVLLDFVQHDLGGGENAAVDTLSCVGADRAALDLWPEAFTYDGDPPAFVVSDYAVVDHDALVLLAPAEDALTFELLESTVGDHHMRVEHDYTRTLVVAVASEVATLDLDHSSVGQHAGSFAARSAQVEFAVHEGHRHILAQNADILVVGLCHCVFAQQVVDLVAQPAGVEAPLVFVLFFLVRLGLFVFLLVLVLLGYVCEEDPVELNRERAVVGPFFLLVADLLVLKLHADVEERALFADEDHVVVGQTGVIFEFDAGNGDLDARLVVVDSGFQDETGVGFQVWVV